MNQLRPRDFDADALVSFGVVYGFGSCVMECANAADDPAAAVRFLNVQAVDPPLGVHRIVPHTLND